MSNCTCPRIVNSDRVPPPCAHCQREIEHAKNIRKILNEVEKWSNQMHYGQRSSPRYPRPMIKV